MSARIKYPRTFHFPWSAGICSDDKVLHDTSHFEGKEVVVTEKFDGECTTLAPDYVHARSTTYAPHPSRDWVRRFHAEIKHLIPEGWRVCGENLYAKHSLGYNNLRSFFYGFSIWEGEVALGWDDTIDYFGLIGIEPVRILWRGIYNEDTLKDLAERLDPDTQEGYVVRLAGSFHISEFRVSVAKFVRKNHVQVDEHWMFKTVVANKLAEDE